MNNKIINFMINYFINRSYTQIKNNEFIFLPLINIFGKILIANKYFSTLYIMLLSFIILSF